ncbi:protein-disulfide reductase DsbD N-terminal domain-containing protein [Chitinophaga pendula]|uniref:protein-disulfide reductase DsbD N-terminal domain-containing protein n=1 Tax=Chitinophaga TaxID=79328 RepID=UPI000BAFC972|nr:MULTISPECIES: protein-disulfide reductase DsbD N-terminal domain-containing protein [Chitinophaga]ASZ12197.1 sugar transporter [Chitinophaga sp. MD30]UCJ04773.1 protein-disulfide reductase DsbD N-terminal domain-containing protein [Chitinophaga pendula]
MKKLLICSLILLAALSASSQILKPVKWSYAARKTSATTATLYFKATIEKGWHIYSSQVAAGGPIKTSFTLTPSAAFELAGGIAEPTPLKKFEEAFNMPVTYFEKSVVFEQRLSLKVPTTIIQGSLEYMVCSDRQCLPPETVKFSIPIK